MKYSYRKYRNTLSFYVTVIQYKSDFNICSVTYKYQNLQICSSVLLNKKEQNPVVREHSVWDLVLLHNPSPLFQSNLHQVFYSAALGLTGR